MEICEKGEFYLEKDDDVFFDHTKVILRRADDEYFYAKTDQRAFRAPKIDISKLAISPIPAEQIWPLAYPKFTRAPDPFPSTYYLKRPSLLHYENTVDRPDFTCQILTELDACEVIRKHPDISSEDKVG